MFVCYREEIPENKADFEVSVLHIENPLDDKNVTCTLEGNDTEGKPALHHVS